MATPDERPRAEPPSVPDALPVLPLRDTVVLPLAAVPLAVGQTRSVRLVDDVMRGNRLVALIAQREPQVEAPAPDQLHRIGTMATIHQFSRSPDGTVRLFVQGLERIQVVDWIGSEPYLVARVAAVPDHRDQSTELDGLKQAAVDLFRRLIGLIPDLPDELAPAAESLTDPAQVTYLIASVSPLTATVR